MSRSTTVRTTTKGSGTRGRGHGRGRQTRRNFISSHPTTPYEDLDENYTYSERRMGSPMFSHSRGNSRRPFNRRHRNFSATENGNDRSDTTSNSSNTNSHTSRIPEHAQNPFFVGELMSRFNNMLPSPIFLEDEKDSTQQPEVSSNPNRDSDWPLHTFDSIINRRISGSNSNFNCKENGPFFDDNKNNETTMKRNTNHEGNSCNRYTTKNRNSGNNHLERTSEGLPQNNFKQREPNSSAAFPNRSRKPENLRVKDSFNRPNSSAKNNHSNNSELEFPSDVRFRKISTSSNKSNKGSTHFKNISLEKRKEIMKQFGFDIESSDEKNCDSSESKTVDNNKQDIPQSLPHRLIASRTSPRIRFNLENETIQNMLPSNTSDQIEDNNSKLKLYDNSPQNSSILDTFLPGERSNNTHLKQISSDKAKPNNQNVKLSNCSSGKPSEENPANNVEKDENTTQQPGLSDAFFAQLDAFGKSSYNPGNKQSLRPLKNNRSAEKNNQNFNPSLKSETTRPQDCPERSNHQPEQRKQRNVSIDRNPGLFLPSNTPRLIDRSVAGRNPINIHRAARDANERVPSRAEALESLQEQYEIQRAIYEQKEKEKEAKKREEYLARYKHVDQGYRLSEGLLDEAAGYTPGFNPFEAVEDVRHRQQEQLRQEALAYQERMREKEEKQKIKEENKIKERLQRNKHYDAGYRLGSGNGKTLYPEVTGAKPKFPKDGYKNVQQGSNPNRSGGPDERNSIGPSSQVAPRQNQSEGLSRVKPKYFSAENRVHVENATEQIRIAENNSAIKNSTPLISQDNLATKRQSKNPQLDQLISKVSRNSESQGAASTQMTSAPVALYKPPTSCVSYDQGAASTQMTSAPVALYKQPASCVIKSRNGAVLVLRPTEEELNQALARKFEVQDDFDKKGYSLHYIPLTEQASLYSNNRFERKPDFDTVKSTGAIPKNSSVPAVKPTSLVPTNGSVVNNETPKQEEPPIDHNAEMRAARQRMQQQYEESLKKKQEQRNEP